MQNANYSEGNFKDKFQTAWSLLFQLINESLNMISLLDIFLLLQINKENKTLTLIFTIKMIELLINVMRINEKIQLI